MSFAPGSVFGGYQVLALLGEGGMGQVYRARDTRLERDVAIKVLPESFAHDPERLARFEREAKTLAALNHPNIAIIHGLEEADGIKALVMELVEGPTLADRLVEGSGSRAQGLPVEEALSIARQICEALEAAHEQGIVHRDLKPANIKVRPDGMVKVLDFGLAKAMAGAGGSGGAELSQSPTLASPVGVTGVGVLLGTAAYMSPEQARGKVVDKRADIWAFGAVLYEMLTGRRAFEGEDVSLTLAEVMKSEPDWNRLPATLPAGVRAVLTRCLQKDPKQRLRDVGDVRLALDGAFEAPTAPGVRLEPKLWQRPVFVLTGALLLTAATGLVVWNFVPSGPVGPPPVRRLAMTFADAAPDAAFALSADGTRLVYPATVDGRSQLYIRSLSEIDARPLPGTENGRSPFFSPDGEWVAFFTALGDEGQPTSGKSRLQKISLTGARPQPICETSAPRGGAWGTDGTIVFAGGTGLARLFRVSAQGGAPEPLADVGPLPAWPEILPGKTVLFSTGTRNDLQLAILALDRGESRSIGRGYYGRYLPSGHIVYMLDDTLMAVPFDASALTTTGPPVSLVEGLETTGASPLEPSLAVSAGGTLVYRIGPSSSARGAQAGTVVVVSRDGHPTAVPNSIEEDNYPRLSPDDSQVAVARGLPRAGLNSDIWIHDLKRGSWERLTTEPSEDSFPEWTPDGSRIAFTSTRTGTGDLYWQPLDRSRGVELLLKSEPRKITSSWSPDGKVLAFYQYQSSPPIQRDIWMLTVGGEARPFLATPFNELAPRLSRDGRCAAYVSEESGEPQVYVQPFPGPGRRISISTDGGEGPLWSRDGRELFYFRRQGPISGQLMAVDVRTEPTCSAGVARALFEGPYVAGANPYPNYDVFRDGQRFVMIQAPAQTTDTSLTVVLNWLEELKRLAPTR